MVCKHRLGLGAFDRDLLVARRLTRGDDTVPDVSDPVKKKEDYYYALKKAVADSMAGFPD